jgi:hypothetical protein
VVLERSFNIYKQLLPFGVFVVSIYVLFLVMIGRILERVFKIKDPMLQFQDALLANKDDINSLRDLITTFLSENGTELMIYSFSQKLLMILVFPLAAGFLLACKEVEEKGRPRLDTLFKGFKSEYWGKLILLGLIYLVLSAIGLFSFFVPGIYVWLVFCLACPVLIFENEITLNSIKKSRTIFHKNSSTVIIVLTLSSLIGLAGYALFYVGRMITYPFVLTSIYALYAVLKEKEGDVENTNI